MRTYIHCSSLFCSFKIKPLVGHNKALSWPHQTMAADAFCCQLYHILSTKCFTHIRLYSHLLCTTPAVSRSQLWFCFTLYFHFFKIFMKGNDNNMTNIYISIYFFSFNIPFQTALSFMYKRCFSSIFPFNTEQSVWETCPSTTRLKKKKTSQRWNDKRLKSGAAKVTARLSGKFWKSPTDPSMQADWTLSTPGIWASSPGVERLNDTDKVQILLFSKWESMCLMRASSGYPVGKVSWHRGQLRTALSSDSIHNCREMWGKKNDWT